MTNLVSNSTKNKSKTKSAYQCTECGTVLSQWVGQCPDCGAWNCIEEYVVTSTVKPAKAMLGQGYSGKTGQTMQLNEVETTVMSRLPTGLLELDRVLGGGLVAGSVVLLGGEPGIGKSTLLLQTLSQLSQSETVFYLTGEESLEQVAMRAKRLSLQHTDLQIGLETNIEVIINLAQKSKAKIICIDSIQTLCSPHLQAAPGTVSQVKECTHQLVSFAKTHDAAVFIVGHVTKEGALAGPRVLEHMVDTVLYFEGSSDNRFRMVRAQKNRFGAVGELGIFAMTDTGLKPVNNPSSMWLSKPTEPVPGSLVSAVWEGTRPLLIEVQALVDDSGHNGSRRVAVGIEAARLTLILAVLSRHGGLSLGQQDVFVNIVGGIKITETGADLSLLLSIVSSFKNSPLDTSVLAFGEVGLTGEIRPVQGGQERIKAAIKHGFKTILVPYGNRPKVLELSGVTVRPFKTVQEVLDFLS